MITRAFLRLAALEALRPTALLASENPTWPTSAGRYVFDSRIDPLDDIETGAARVSVSVYTELHNLDPIAQSGPVFYDETVDLVFELSVATKLADDNGSYVALLQTDHGIETRLDILEWQIMSALMGAPAGSVFRRLARLPFRDWQSNVDRSGEEAVRKSMRTVRAKVNLRPICEIANPPAAATGLDRLPPALKAIAEQLSQSSYGRELIEALASDVPLQPTLPALSGVSFAVNAAGTPAPEPDGFAPHVSFTADDLSKD